MNICNNKHPLKTMDRLGNRRSEMEIRPLSFLWVLLWCFITAACVCLAFDDVSTRPQSICLPLIAWTVFQTIAYFSQSKVADYTWLASVVAWIIVCVVYGFCHGTIGICAFAVIVLPLVRIFQFEVTEKHSPDKTFKEIGKFRILLLKRVSISWRILQIAYGIAMLFAICRAFG